MKQFNYRGRIITANSREQAVRKATRMSNAVSKRREAPAGRRIHASSRLAGRRRAKAGMGETITMGIDYTIFMRLLDSAAYFSGDDDYKKALWEYYSQVGEIDDALVFFDNLFQYTAWWDENELAEEAGIEAGEDEDLEEACDRWLEENDNEVRSMYVKKYKGGYLVIM